MFWSKLKSKGFRNKLFNCLWPSHLYQHLKILLKIKQCNNKTNPFQSFIQTSEKPLSAHCFEIIFGIISTEAKKEENLGQMTVGTITLSCDIYKYIPIFWERYINMYLFVGGEKGIMQLRYWRPGLKQPIFKPRYHNNVQLPSYHN